MTPVPEKKAQLLGDKGASWECMDRKGRGKESLSQVVQERRRGSSKGFQR